MTDRPDGIADAARAGWHAASPEAVLGALSSGPAGLQTEEAARRLQVHGPNRLAEAPRRSALMRFLAQFHNLLIYVLIASGAVAAAIGHPTDALVIAAVVIANAVIGFVQEGRAESALDAIRGMLDPRASVIRGGRRATIPARDVVPGDVLALEAGDRIPADVRLLSAHSLRVDESVLTGESVPVEKTVEPAALDAAVGDRTSMGFSGTLVTAGQGTGVVVATGAGTELGRISALLGEVEQLATPLVRRMDQFARQVSLAVGVVSVVVLAYATLVRDYAFEDALMVVIGLAVAAIPEGLPAVLTIALAVGVRRMARRNAIVRRLPAVETLGSVSVICTDKTGTLTRNEMMVRSAVTADGRAVVVDGVGYRPDGAFTAGDGPLDPAADPALRHLARAVLLCNDAVLARSGDHWTVEGDPMEGALVAFAAKAGLDPDRERTAAARTGLLPFDARHRFMATAHPAGDGGTLVYVKGAPEAVIELAAEADGAPVDRARWHMAVEALAADGQRVLAVATGRLARGGEPVRAADLEGRLTLLGLVGLIDPPRPEATDAVAECRAAGIGVKMITGDHAATARAIALQLGLADDPRTVTGRDLDRLDADGFRRHAREATVFARTSPEQKLRLVEALQADGSTVAMTGDGVNDAPALKRADVGVAMGAKGTEAAKEASEIVLADDNFASIVAAVREGRTVYDNVKKVIAWTLPTNGGEALVIMIAVLFGLTLPVTPVQILWINMVTAVSLGLTLAFEPTEPGTMRRPARPPDEPLLTGRLALRILGVSALMVAGCFGVYAYALGGGQPVEVARTLVVNAIVVMEIFYLFSVRYVHGASLTVRGAMGTPAVLLGVGGVIVAQLAFTYLPVMNAVFDSRPVSLTDGLAVMATGIVLFAVVEAEKRWAARRR
ncbi:cation-transporting P-type ATPase [Chthonobacter rhizosphaerae]|uniref:cation-transporting P-type ATPase n=1 Tax=Chthonobacter rhizosphaerae TaxID=2735553 RepID=UPI0015EE76B4|nr:cation-transporting P-type ATPase [Chthonobacter rhizosphaerae]